MIDQNDYALAWQVYLGVGVIALLLWLLLLRAYRLTGPKLWALLAVAALVLLPSHHPDVAGLWMPATIGALLSLMTGGIESAMASLIIIGAGQIADWRYKEDGKYRGAYTSRAMLGLAPTANLDNIKAMFHDSPLP